MQPSTCPVLSRLPVVAFTDRNTDWEEATAYAIRWDTLELAEQIAADQKAVDEFQAALDAADIDHWLAGGSLDTPAHDERDVEFFEEAA